MTKAELLEKFREYMLTIERRHETLIARCILKTEESKVEDQLAIDAEVKARNEVFNELVKLEYRERFEE